MNINILYLNQIIREHRFIKKLPDNRDRDSESIIEKDTGLRSFIPIINDKKRER